MKCRTTSPSASSGSLGAEVLNALLGKTEFKSISGTSDLGSIAARLPGEESSKSGRVAIVFLMESILGVPINWNELTE